MDAPTLQSLTTVAGATILTTAIMFVLLKAIQFAPSTQDRFGPALAIIVGIIIVEAATFTVISGAGKADALQGAITGLFAGLAAIGVQNVGTKTLSPGQ